MSVYNPTIRKMCVGITGRDNASAHRRAAKNPDWDKVLREVFPDVIDHWTEKQWGRYWEILRDRANFGNEWHQRACDSIETIIGKVW